MVLKNVVRMVLVGLFMASVCLNIVTVSGCLSTDRLVREKGDLIGRFETQVRELEAGNKQLGIKVIFLQNSLEELRRKRPIFQKEFDDIMNRYGKLNEEKLP